MKSERELEGARAREELVEGVDLLQSECSSHHSVHARQSGQVVLFGREELLSQGSETGLKELESTVVSEDRSRTDLAPRILGHSRQFSSSQFVLSQDIGRSHEVKQILDDESIPQPLVTGVEVEFLIQRLVSRQLEHESIALHLENEDRAHPKEVRY